MKSLDIVDAGLVLLTTQNECAPYPGLQELIEELQILRHRLKHRLHRREHSGHTTEIIGIGDIELVVEYRYISPLHAPPCQNPSDTLYSIPPESGELDVLSIWTHDNIAGLLNDAPVYTEIESQIQATEQKQRGIL